MYFNAYFPNQYSITRDIYFSNEKFQKKHPVVAYNNL